MKGYNKVMLIGRLAADPEYRQTPSGKAVVNFPLAVHRKSVKDPDGADFHHVVAWGSMAEFSKKILKKGMAVFVIGKILKRFYEGKNGKQTVTEIVMEDVNILTWKGRESTAQDPAESEEELDVDEIDVSGEDMSATLSA